MCGRMTKYDLSRNKAISNDNKIFIFVKKELMQSFEWVYNFANYALVFLYQIKDKLKEVYRCNQLISRLISSYLDYSEGRIIPNQTRIFRSRSSCHFF
jgi:hypothetical protein